MSIALRIVARRFLVTYATSGKEHRLKFAPGEVLVRRHWRGGRVSAVYLVRVAADDERGLRLWLPAGSPYWRLVADDGNTHRDTPVDRLRAPRLDRQIWTGNDTLI